ncbi:MAG: hypothetical protein JO357_02065 [Hyphomicrobiales bacterium]|nr:hypothetical protein [Hyphomicrobiales bacterium]MBV9052724.1 hypothetical protein [Hyphomicrobiales bacterium]MBV9135819.1 hypothetical protein [Hyphomicrobiales bacterium]MBV9975157.1 hypothetical protein [Hyphomicrobiales bacterium]
MAHIHLTGALDARAEEDAFTRSSSFYVRLTDGQATRIYLPARDAAHARAMAAAINGTGRPERAKTLASSGSKGR